MLGTAASFPNAGMVILTTSEVHVADEVHSSEALRKMQVYWYTLMANIKHIHSKTTGSCKA